MGKVKIRYANDSEITEVTTFDISKFEMTNIFENEVYGKWNDTYIMLDREDYDRLKK